MIKRILVPTDGSEEARIGVRYAVALAEKLKAVLVGLYVVDIKLLEGPFLRDISASLGTAPYVNYQGNIAMILEEKGIAALDVFKQACTDAGVNFETKQITGAVVGSIVEASELCDVIVLGRVGEHSQWLDGLVGSTTQNVVRRASRPVIVTPNSEPSWRKVLIAYDGSHHAKEALRAISMLETQWDTPFCVLCVGSKEPTTEMVSEAKAYLAAHEVPVDFVTREGDPSEVIVEYAEEIDADLLILGAYGHTKVRELVVGSTTAYAITHCRSPLLLVR